MTKQITALVLVFALLLPLLTGCGKSAGESPTEAVTQPTAPAETVPADGDPDDVTCLGSYTAENGALNPGSVVATIEGQPLTAGQLQVYYWLEVAAYRQAQQEVSPDFSRPLDVQPCGIDNSVNSWQQYFLREALNTWHTQQALILHSGQNTLPTEEAYQPDMEKYAEYMPEVPALRYLYGYHQYYQPNELHQAYLDTLPDTLAALAADSGFAGVDALVSAVAGPGADTEDVLTYARTANYAYMYFTELGYRIAPTEEEITAHYEAHKGDLQGETLEKTVDIRHILLIPNGGTVAADGTVSADDDSWNACSAQAEEILKTWRSKVRNTRYADKTPADPAESRFAELAKDLSADTGSAPSGGLYQNLRQGQLTEVLDAWCFDASRQHGDVDILRSPVGIHVVFFSGAKEGWYAAAEASLIQTLSAEAIRTIRDSFSIHLDYSAIRLGQAEDNGSFLLPSDLLYPDIAHQRYPSIPLYIQQDYPDAMYGFYKLSTHGCGICVLAMVASYMTDQEITPPELAERYGYYNGKHGSEVIIMDDTPAEMGFFLDKRTYDWNEIDNALKNGQPVASMQLPGYWTRGGHFILMADITEDGRYVVRDSNLLNYKRLPAFAEDCHTLGSIRAAGQFYWIFEKKVTSTAACIRCGGEDRQNVPAELFRQEYHCQKCLTAMARRETYLENTAG